MSFTWPSTASRKAPGESNPSAGKSQGQSEPDIELQKLVVLAQEASNVTADPTPDALTAFGNQVAAELKPAN